MKFKTDLPPDDKEEVAISEEKEILNPFEKFNKDFYSFQTQEKEDANIDSIKQAEGGQVDSKEKEILISIIKATKASGEKFDIEDIENLSLEEVDLDKFLFAPFMLSERRSLLSEEEIKEYESIVKDTEQMRKIYSDNYSYNPDLKGNLIEDFDKFIGIPSEKYKFEGLSSRLSELYILKYKDKVISFNRFDLKFLNKYYFKFFNVDKNVQGSGIGQLMCRETLNKKAKDSAIEADCIASKPISSFYIENGFIAKHMSDIYGEQILSIIRSDKEIHKEFKTKNLSEEEIFNEKNLPNGTIVNRSKAQKDCDFSYLIPENYTDASEILPYHKAPEKYVLTRYFFDDKTKEWITVFEPVVRDLDDFL